MSRKCSPLMIAMVLFFALLTTAGAWATAPETLYAFGISPGSGYAPVAALVQDAKGNLYGTTLLGGGSLNCYSGCGAIYELSPTSDGGWTYTSLHSFTGGSDGSFPESPLVRDAAGDLYGTASTGGIVNSNCSQGCGTVYELSPASGGGWTFKILHSFEGTYDGARPLAGLVFDAAGNLYGTANQGGPLGAGTVFKLTRSSRGTWEPSLVYTFKRSDGGAFPVAGLVLDASGNLYGVASDGGTLGYGTAFELSPSTSGSGWIFRLLHSFAGAGTGDGAFPYGTLILDKAGNLYGTTIEGGSAGGYGTAYMLEPNSKGWSEHVLHSFGISDGINPSNGLVAAGGDLYGTTISGGDAGCGNCGTIFKLSRTASGPVFATVYDFTGQNDGSSPVGALMIGIGGNLYGTTEGGGAGDGVVFQLSR